ncbi:MAG TPA: GatB/YqeY domain-containing protein [Thermoanaerobaculia bacterium]|nr:GatB/YqeY domain-containing protein [Thermoanaerobaculia bacterium]
MADQTPQQRIELDLRGAMKAGEKERVGTLRMLLTELKNERIRRGAEVDEAGFLAALRKGIKQREEAAEQFDKGNRPEQAAKERREAEILGAYLPAAPSEDDIRRAVEAYVAEHGLSGPQAMGQVMPAMIQRFEGRADNAVVSRVAREVLISG